MECLQGEFVFLCRITLDYWPLLLAKEAGVTMSVENSNSDPSHSFLFLFSITLYLGYPGQDYWTYF